MNADMPAKKKAPARQAVKKSDVAIKKPRVFGIAFARVYPLYVQKAENKGRTKGEVDEVIAWLTGYSGKTLQRTGSGMTRLARFLFLSTKEAIHEHPIESTTHRCAVRAQCSDRARKRAEKAAAATGTAIIQWENGSIVRIYPGGRDNGSGSLEPGSE